MRSAQNSYRGHFERYGEITTTIETQPTWFWLSRLMSSGTAEHGGDNFSSKVTSQVPLQYDPNFGISSEITLQRFNLPTQGAYRLNCHRIHLSRGAAQLQYRAYEISSN